MDRLTRLWKLLCLAAFVVTNAQKAERDIDVCDEMTDTRGRLVHLYNTDFPGYPPFGRYCNCTIWSANDRALSVYFRMFITSSRESLVLKYGYSDEYMTWAGFSANFTSRDFNDGRFLVTDSAKSIEIVYKHTEELKSIFALDVAANRTDELRISCEQRPFTTGEDKDSNSDGVIGYIESLCSPFILIVLGSVCTAFLLIIIGLAVMLCFTVRKGHKVRFRHSSESGQPLSNQSSLGLPMESYRVASRIYDDGMAKRTSANGNQQFPVPRHHSVPTVRESVGYANTLDMNLYGNT